MYTSPTALSEQAIEFWARKIIKESFSAPLKLQGVLSEVIRMATLQDHGVALCIAVFSPETEALEVEAASPRLVNRLPLGSRFLYTGPTFAALTDCTSYCGPVVSELQANLGQGLKRQCSVPIQRQGQPIGVLIGYHDSTDGFQEGGRKRLETLGHVMYHQLRTRLLRERFVRIEPMVLSSVR